MGSVLIKSSRYGNWNVLYIEKKKEREKLQPGEIVPATLHLCKLFVLLRFSNGTFNITSSDILRI